MATVQIMQALGIKSSEMKDRGNVSVDKQKQVLRWKTGLFGYVPPLVCGPWGLKFHSFFSFLPRPASWENQFCPEAIIPTSTDSLAAWKIPPRSLAKVARPLVAEELRPLVWQLLWDAGSLMPVHRPKQNVLQAGHTGSTE